MKAEKLNKLSPFDRLRLRQLAKFLVKQTLAEEDAETQLRRYREWETAVRELTQETLQRPS